MLQIVDLYVKTVIAVFGFIAPTVTLIWPILGLRTDEISKQVEEEEMQSSLVRDSYKSEYGKIVQSITDKTLSAELSKTADKHIKKQTKEFDKRIDKLNGKLLKLNLRRQIRNIFLPLLIALILVVIYYIVKGKMYFFYQWSEEGRRYCGVGILALSASVFIYAIYELWSVVCIIVDQAIKPKRTIVSTARTVTKDTSKTVEISKTNGNSGSQNTP